MELHLFMLHVGSYIEFRDRYNQINKVGTVSEVSDDCIFVQYTEDCGKFETIRVDLDDIVRELDVHGNPILDELSPIDEAPEKKNTKSSSRIAQLTKSIKKHQDKIDYLRTTLKGSTLAEAVRIQRKIDGEMRVIAERNKQIADLV